MIYKIILLITSTPPNTYTVLGPNTNLFTIKRQNVTNLGGQTTMIKHFVLRMHLSVCRSEAAIRQIRYPSNKKVQKQWLMPVSF